MPSSKEYQARYHREVWYPKNKARRIQLNKERIARLQKAITDTKMASGCLDCGYRQHPEALDFDHKGDKIDNVSNMFRLGVSWSRLLAEMSKCDIVCANCHRVRTANRRTGKSIK